MPSLLALELRGACIGGVNKANGSPPRPWVRAIRYGPGSGTFIGEWEIGRIGAGKRKPNGQLDVAMIQSLVRKGSVDDIVAEYGHVIVDECHHVPAVSFERVLSEVRARYVVGLTATLHRRDGHHPILEMQLGPVRFSVDAKNQAARRPFEHRLTVRETAFRLDGSAADATIQDIYRALASDHARNRLLVDDVVRALGEGRSPILLTERRDHIEYLAAAPSIRPTPVRASGRDDPNGATRPCGGPSGSTGRRTTPGTGNWQVHRRGV